MNENFKAYKINKHQHIPEIEQVLGDIAGEDVTITFTTQLVPMTRGIMSTIYVTLKGDYTDQDLIGLYRDYYKDQPFVRVRGEGVWYQQRRKYLAPITAISVLQQMHGLGALRLFRSLITS